MALVLQCQDNITDIHSFFLGAGNTDHAHVLRDRDPREDCGRANIWSSSGICLSIILLLPIIFLSIYLIYYLSSFIYFYLS